MYKYIFAEQRAANYPRLRSGYCDKYCDLWLIKRDVRCESSPVPGSLPASWYPQGQPENIYSRGWNRTLDSQICKSKQMVSPPCSLSIVNLHTAKYSESNIGCVDMPRSLYHNSSIKSLLTQVFCPDQQHSQHQWPLAASPESICFSKTTHRQFSTRISSYLDQSWTFDKPDSGLVT